MCLRLPVSVQLPPAKTCDHRSAVWTRGGPAGVDAVLTISQGRAKGRVRDDETYFVQLLRGESGEMVALLAKQSADGDVYECRRAERGYSCSCKAAQCRLGCKHSSSLLALESEGVFDGDPCELLDADPDYKAWRDMCDRKYAESVDAIF